MELIRRILIIQDSFSQYVFSYPSLCVFFLSISLIFPNTELSRNIKDFQNFNDPYSKFYKKIEIKKNKPDTLNKKIKLQKISNSHTKISRNQIAHSVSKLHLSFFEKKNHLNFNERMRRIIISFLQFEAISRKRFNRGTKSLSTQAELEDLAEHIVESRWYREAIKRFSSNNAYGFSEERLLRVLFSIQVASNSFDIPYPALFCLFFQESKFDFLANSHTGAKGIGQLTSIAIKEISRLRNNQKRELLLQKTAAHLNKVYTDPQINLWLKKLGFKIELPNILPIPKKIEFTKINSAFIKDVGFELVKRGHSYGANIGLLWYLSKKIRRGRILSEPYALTHKVFSQMLADRYASSPSSTYNIETNILASTMLFNHYYRYKWQHGKELFNLKEDTRTILAASAYNHGQSGMRRFLINLKHEFPALNFKNLSANKLSNYFTQPRLSKALKRPKYKIREASRHVKNIMKCSSKRPNFIKYPNTKI